MLRLLVGLVLLVALPVVEQLPALVALGALAVVLAALAGFETRHRWGGDWATSHAEQADPPQAASTR